jgi:hypothetical protein
MGLPVTAGWDTAWIRISVSAVTPLALRCSALNRMRHSGLSPCPLEDLEDLFVGRAIAFIYFISSFFLNCGLDGCYIVTQLMRGGEDEALIAFVGNTELRLSLGLTYPTVNSMSSCMGIRLGCSEIVLSFFSCDGSCNYYPPIYPEMTCTRVP